MGLETFNTRMERSTLASFMKILFVDLESHKAGFINIKASGKMEKCMEMESVYGGMEWVKWLGPTQANIKKGWNMGMVNTNGVNKEYTKVIGRKGTWKIKGSFLNMIEKRIIFLYVSFNTKNIILE